VAPLWSVIERLVCQVAAKHQKYNSVPAFISECPAAKPVPSAYDRNRTVLLNRTNRATAAGWCVCGLLGPLLPFFPASTPTKPFGFAATSYTRQVRRSRPESLYQ